MVTERVSDGPDHLAREMTMFVRDADGRYRREFERHDNVLVDVGVVAPAVLEPIGFDVEVGTRFGGETKGFFDGSNPRMQILLDTTKKVPEGYGTTMFPESYVLDREGRVRYRFVGDRQWNSETMLRFFRGVMAEL